MGKGYKVECEQGIGNRGHILFLPSSKSAMLSCPIGLHEASHVNSTTFSLNNIFAITVKLTLSISMAGAQFLNLLNSSSRSSLAKPSRPLLYSPIKNYAQASKGKNGGLERTPSTAEEFERVAEERAKQAQNEVASQSLGKAMDGAEEASIGNPKVESVKNRYKGNQ
ncbi:hypothetical protein VNO78_27627 [Psophocarpus tetragonolobus]|uniref:Uncharacterized protein n=1 Tax=Psophocarpus tetragonolobus TaxID=3891 RepID=A0AAN9S3M3_PSOTE